MMTALERLLYDSALDLSQSRVDRSDLAQFVVRARLGPARIFLCLLFGVPCLVLLHSAWNYQGLSLLAALIFCPVLVVLSLLFGFARQAKAFVPVTGTATKSWQLLNMQGERHLPLPRHGTVLTYKQWSSGSERGGCYFHYAEVEGLKGFVFCIARNEAQRNAFSEELSRFLGYDIRDEGERHE
jgi:hypothetical protein